MYLVVIIVIVLLLLMFIPRLTSQGLPFLHTKNSSALINSNVIEPNDLLNSDAREIYLINTYPNRFYDYGYYDYYPQNMYHYWPKQSHYEPHTHINHPTPKPHKDSKPVSHKYRTIN